MGTKFADIEKRRQESLEKASPQEIKAWMVLAGDVLEDLGKKYGCSASWISKTINALTNEFDLRNRIIEDYRPKLTSKQAV